MSGKPDAEVEVDCETVVRLIADQCPDMAHLPVSHLGSGWDNFMFHVGEDYIARLPRRALSVKLLDNERRFLPNLEPILPIPVPAFLHVGKPGHGYPWPWLLIPRFQGDNPDRNPLMVGEAARLAEFLLQLHRIDDGQAPSNNHRDVPLLQRDDLLQEHWEALSARREPMANPLVNLWRQACALPAPSERRWLHADLHYANVLVQDGRFSAIVDWGDICAGDPATDLAAFWLLFDDADARAIGIKVYGADAEMKVRAMGWALSWATVLRATGLNNDMRHAASGKAVMRRLLEDIT